MEIFFSPEFLRQDGQILNVVDGQNHPVGYVSYLLDEKKIYVYGHLENEGISEIYKDMVKAYIDGIAKSNPGREVYSYISVGGKTLQLENGGQ